MTGVQTCALPISYINFQDKPIFVIDCACFPGSSGSPVYLFNNGGYVDKNGNTNLGTNRVKLLGVLYAGPQFNATGELEVVPIPTALSQKTHTHIPMNLGYCVKAEELNWFEKALTAPSY